jgi:hypothetical protein
MMDQGEAYLWKQRAQMGADRIKELERLLGRAYPLLHNPYTQQHDPLLATTYDQIIRDVELAIQPLKDEPDPERVTLPCASCDGVGCENCAPASVD